MRELLLNRVKRAADELIPQGVVLAWSHKDGANVEWSEIVEALEELETLKGGSRKTDEEKVKEENDE